VHGSKKEFCSHVTQPHVPWQKSKVLNFVLQKKSIPSKLQAQWELPQF
jgi:hypothetical protein